MKDGRINRLKRPPAGVREERQPALHGKEHAKYVCGDNQLVMWETEASAAWLGALRAFLRSEMPEESAHTCRTARFP